MDDHVHEIIEFTGTLTESIEDAVTQAIAKAGRTLKNIRWFEVSNLRDDVANGKAHWWQAMLDLDLTLAGRAAETEPGFT